MAGSIPASATAEAPAVGLPASRRRRRSGAAHLARTPAGALGLAFTATVAAAAAFAGILAPAHPFAIAGPPLAAPSAAHPMGTDAIGRDVLSGVLHGARTSLLLVAAVAVLVLAIGVVVGTVSGYRAGRVDDVLMRFTELVQVLPRFFLAIVVLAMFGPGIERLALVLGLSSWCVLARVVRAEVLSLREREFVQAAVASGASDLRIVVREILPNVLPTATVYLGLLLAQVLLVEASLGFLGLGDPSRISWGYLASQAQPFLRVAWWLSVFPGLAIVVAVLGLNLLADAFGDAWSRRG